MLLCFQLSILLACYVYAGKCPVKTTVLLLEQPLAMHVQTAAGAHPRNRIPSVYCGCDEP